MRHERDPCTKTESRNTIVYISGIWKGSATVILRRQDTLTQPGAEERRNSISSDTGGLEKAGLWMDQSLLKKKKQSCLFILFFSLGINLSPFFSACTGTREHMNNTLPRPKRYKGLCAWELAASIKTRCRTRMTLLAFGSGKGCAGETGARGEMRSGVCCWVGSSGETRGCREGVEQDIQGSAGAHACLSPGLVPIKNRLISVNKDLRWLLVRSQGSGTFVGDRKSVV